MDGGEGADRYLALYCSADTSVEWLGSSNYYSNFHHHPLLGSSLSLPWEKMWRQLISAQVAHTQWRSPALRHHNHGGDKNLLWMSFHKKWHIHRPIHTFCESELWQYDWLEIYQALLWSIVSISRKISFIGNIAYLHNCVFMLWFPLRFGLLFQGEGKYPKKLNVKTFPISSSNRGASNLHWSWMPSKQKALVYLKTATKIYISRLSTYPHLQFLFNYGMRRITRQCLK